ncbi:chemotaxis protein CheR [Niveibacterium umoris]|uniref:protein-glutamate O-methyltransferase n=1 Tax=Niveibacterium umoris TaxID=1193620 RepID=A0A840BDW7_9RHOO|nr:CheR family methyltransferase [Niveibacterium umoris]MBB4011220.1 chemotaxis protein methyltransferase CheR [Niveibacterium umoris]
MSDKPDSRVPPRPPLTAPRTTPLGATPRPGLAATRPLTPTGTVPPGAVQRAKIVETLGKIDVSGREFAFTSADFERVRGLIYKHAGIALSPIKQDMVYSRLARRLRAKSMRSFTEYLDALERNNDTKEWEEFVNALTTNLTSFFREAHHFDTLAKQMRAMPPKQVFKIWCCAASTGEEPYSLAITACEAYNSLTPPVQIIATDLDTNVLKHGEQGMYGMDRVERLERERLQKFFLKGTGEQAGKVRVRPELQRLLSFRRLNLLEPNWPVQGPFDAIFCRNVMIYFDKPTQYKILHRFVPLLKPEGFMYAGHSENFMHAADLFRSLGRTVYARADQRS